MHRLLSGDARITDRAIASELKNNGLLLIRRETNLRKLWATDTLFTTIPCLKMKTVPISECAEYVDDCMIARSEMKLPRIAEGNYQYLIQGVYTVNAMSGRGRKINASTINRYINSLKLRQMKKESVFWIHNDYLYVTNPNIEAVRISALFEESVPAELMLSSECAGAVPQLCSNPQDEDFFVPGYLKKQVLALTSQTLLQTYFNLKEDMSDNNVDGQAPNSPNLS